MDKSKITQSFSKAMRQLMSQAEAMLDLKESQLEEYRKAIVETEKEIEEIKTLVAFSRGEKPPGRRKYGPREHGKLQNKATIINLIRSNPNSWFDATNIAALVGIDASPIGITRIKKFLYNQSRIGMLHVDGGRWKWNSAFTGPIKFVD